MRVALMDTALQASEDVFAVAARLGCDGVEVSLTRADLRGAGPESLARRRESHGLEIHALVLGEHNHGGLADADPTVREAAAEDVRAAIGWASAVGAGVVLVPFFLRGEIVDDDGFDRCAEELAALCPRAAEHGVTLCFEGLLAAREIRRLGERVGSHGFGAYVDLANPLRRALDTPTEIRSLRELVTRVHVKDILATPGDVHPGLGRVDFTECARALEEIGYDVWLTLETPTSPSPLVARDLSYARAAFGLGNPRPWPRFAAMTHELAPSGFAELGERAAALGLDSVQLGGDLLSACVASPERTEDGRRTLADHGVELAGLAGYRNLVAPDPDVREANIAYIGRCLELAPTLGTHVIATETGTRNPAGDWVDTPENWRDEAWRLLDDALGRLVPIAERAGTILALEGYVKNVLKTQSQLLGVLERFPSAHLQVVCDPYNYVARDLVPAQVRATAELLHRFEDRFVLAHLKDVASDGAHEGTPELGQGIFDQPPYLAFLRDRRPDLDLVLEHLPPEHIPRVIETVRRLAA